VPAGASQAGEGQYGTAGRDGGAGQRDTDLSVVSQGAFGFGQPVAGGLQALGVQLV